MASGYSCNMNEEYSDLASQCMAFCQVLRSKGRKGCKGQKFSFVLNVAFSFSMDTILIKCERPRRRDIHGFAQNFITLRTKDTSFDAANKTARRSQTYIIDFTVHRH